MNKQLSGFKNANWNKEAAAKRFAYKWISLCVSIIMLTEIFPSHISMVRRDCVATATAAYGGTKLQALDEVNFERQLCAAIGWRSNRYI